MLGTFTYHPFAVEAFFQHSTVLTFAFPKAELQALLPECLELDTFNKQWGFVAVALVQTKGLRPQGVPAFLGSDFFLIGYRVFVRYTNAAGKRLRGLYILKSETDSHRMKLLGSMVTQYRYDKIDVKTEQYKDRLVVSSAMSGLKIDINEPAAEDPPLPETSPFACWKEARRFAGPLPFTFSYREVTNQVIIVEGVRENWQPRPIQVNICRVPFISALKQDANVKLASAFKVENIPYSWKKGKVERWHR